VVLTAGRWRPSPARGGGPYREEGRHAEVETAGTGEPITAGLLHGTEASMSSAARVTRPPGPPAPTAFGQAVRRFTVEQYHRMHEAGILTASDRCELIHGVVVQRPPVNPPHATALTRLSRRLYTLAGDELVARIQLPVTLAGSEPYPDALLAAGTDADYEARHPGPKDVRLVVEVSDSTLPDDRTTKLALYAAARLPVYWVVNLKDRRVEVYTDPRGGKNPGYRTRTDYAPGDDVPVSVDGAALGTAPAAELLP
jgi:Uma2 family endonuclease